MTTAIEPLLTREEVADILRCSVSTVRRHIAAKRLRAKKLGKLVRIEPEDLQDFRRRFPEVDVVKTEATPYLPGLFIKGQ
jgi:excisionase family DNA binding protein